MLYILRRSRPFAAQHVLHFVTRLAVLLAPFGLLSCGGGGVAVYVSTDPGPSPFISMVHVSGSVVGSVTAVQYTIAPKPGSVSKAVHVEYSIAALQARGDASDGTLTVPVFGPYAGYDNRVSVELSRQGSDPIPFEVDITTASYVDATGTYSQPDIVVSRTASSSHGRHQVDSGGSDQVLVYVSFTSGQGAHPVGRGSLSHRTTRFVDYPRRVAPVVQ